MTVDRESALKLQDEQDPPSWRSRSIRAKTISGTIPRATAQITAQKHEARAVASRMFGHACESSRTTHREVAGTLGIAERRVSLFAEVGSAQNVQVGDIITLAIAGRRIARVYLADLLKFAESHARRLDLTQAEHLRRLIVAVGRVGSSCDRVAYVDNLRQLLAAVNDAILDAEGL